MLDENPHAGCDRQDITRARITQDIGVVAVIDSSGLLLAISSGHSHHWWTKREATLDELETIHVAEIFHEDIVTVVHQGIDYIANEKPPKARTYVCDIFYDRRTYVTILAQSDGRLVVEIEDFERHTMAINTIVDTANVIGKLTANNRQPDTVNDLSKALFESSCYDRVMTYKFLDDLSGEVIYELVRDGTVQSSFLGLRYPPGDIPLPARKAYAENPVRFISDVEKPSCRLLQKNDDISLSRSFLRGCVAPHKCYLNAMGVRSSLSIAVMNMDGGLWGLVTMHSYTKPIQPTVEDRVSYSILASVASSHVQHIEDAERRAMERRMKNLVSTIDPKKSLGVFLVQNKRELLETFNIDSISLFTPDGPPTTVGENGAVLEDVPISHEPLTCGSLGDPVRSFACLTVLGYRIVFTRRCSYEPIRWAGNPEELGTSEVSSDLAMPRKSFDEYLDHQTKHPPPFTKQERIIFAKTGDLLKSVIHQIKIEHIERKIAQTKKESDMIVSKSDENYAFFANMSHELRTPLHAISGVLDIVHDLDDDTTTATYGEQVRRYSKIGLDTCKDMMRTLNDILTIVKKTHENKHIEVSLVMVKDLFNSTSHGLETFAATNGVRFNVAFECDTHRLIRIDVQKSIQIYNNIVGNAIKFSSGEGSVNVRLHVLDSKESMMDLWAEASRGYAGTHKEETEVGSSSATTGASCKWLVVQTQDTGCGIRQHDLSSIFHKFSQVGDVVTKTFASTGLGLHITLVNVKAMHGSIYVASTPGTGTLFFCALPVEESNSVESRTQPASKEAPETTTTTPDMAVTDPVRGFGDDPVVFAVVDDSRVNLMIATKQIQRAFTRAEIHTAANGLLGVEKVHGLKNKGVRLNGIFMDYHMPVMSGLEATRLIRKAYRHVPIAMLTADITETSRQSMLSSGADFILLKPSRPREVVEMCTKMIQLRVDREKAP